ncbi:argininosuccinate lyase, partial [Candidatus Bathyarchaeota archaeon]|nr:argininosuccinate lyase [Candidatus Bathyarchaeota archaeon]
MVEASKLLRGGRITSTREDVIKYISSAASDKKLLGHIIKINLAHTKMLAEQGIIKNEEASKLLKALNKVKDTKTSDSFEDVHIQVEEQVIDLVGSKIGGNLQIGKSRNDQVSTAIRMELRTELLNLANLLINLQKNMIELSKKHVITVILGYTH